MTDPNKQGSGTPTPRTDAASFDLESANEGGMIQDTYEDGKFCLSSHAKLMESELSAALAQNKLLIEAGDKMEEFIKDYRENQYDFYADDALEACNAAKGEKK